MKILILAALALGGCSTLQAIEPNTIAPEIVHMSHATQHAPFTSTPTEYGVNIAQVTATWDLPHHFYVNVSEGLALNRHYADGNSCGEIEGPREQFTLRLGYAFVVKP